MGDDDFKENADAITTPPSGGSSGSGGSGDDEPYPHPPGDLNKKTPTPGPQ